MKAATKVKGNMFYINDISIHAAREGGDVINEIMNEHKSISIHAAREGGDSDSNHTANNGNISIHAAREGGDGQNANGVPLIIISIHAAREGGDAAQYNARRCVKLFQSTPPVKAATNNGGLK